MGHPPPPYGPPGRPPQRRRGGGGRVAGVLVLVILVVVAALVRVGVRTGVNAVNHAGGRVGYTYAPTAGKLPGGTAPITETGSNPLLADPGSPLSPARCHYAPWSTQVDAARKFFESAATCLEQAWKPVLSAAKLPFTAPSVNVTASTAGITTPCTGSSSNFAAFYCGANQTIYMPISQLQTDLFGNHWEIYLSVFAHEYGHHVQAQSGILSAANKQRREVGPKSTQGLEVSRRIELQANCFDGMFLSASAGGGSLSAAQSGNAREDAYGRGDAPGDMRDHGTAQHMGEWFSTGFDQNRTARCNTFIAPSGQVS
ncbi:neutral zinc metallopeptidase [Nocardia sp. CDC159]|uniref:Neutral zinc metallopeptidase n=2 Tax=Nocardiaceae TaxID=85025 RepID=A0A9X2E1T3_9NOCA|nr:neutral zinc metallopeptidase [Nocardia pulmonis]MCM6786063.1 neutral zinc metallopeptidase [Nocardia sp. CDC159]